MATTRAKRPEIKISVKDFNALTAYCKVTEGATVTKIVNDLVGEFLEKDDVKQAIAAASVDQRKVAAIQKKKDKIAQLQAEIAALESGEE